MEHANFIHSRFTSTCEQYTRSKRLDLKIYEETRTWKKLNYIIFNFGKFLDPYYS